MPLNRQVICSAIAEHITSDCHVVRIRESDNPQIKISPKVIKYESPRDIHANPAVYWITFGEDDISIYLDRATGRRVVSHLYYEDPFLLENLAIALSRLGIRFIQ